MVDETVKMISICGFEGMFLQYSSIAQSVEHAAVNRAVVGSSPTRGVFLVLSDVFGEPDEMWVSNTLITSSNLVIVGIRI